MTEPKEIIKMQDKDFWAWWGKTSPKHDSRYQDELPAGQPTPGKGGSKSGKKRKKPPKKATVYDFYG